MERDQVLWLGEYDLSHGDKIHYDVRAEGGEEMRIGFARADGELPDTVYYFVSSSKKEGRPECSADFICSSPVQPGRYRLFLKAVHGDLADVNGEIIITPYGQ